MGLPPGVTHNGMTHPPWLWIETFCVLLTAPGLILVLAHNRRAINENEDRPPA